MEMGIHGDRLGTEGAFHANGINKHFPWMRRRKGKSQMWDSKIWSQVPKDEDPRNTALARVSSIYKRQTHPLVREGAQQKQDRNSRGAINIWSWAPGGCSLPRLTDWLTVSRNMTLTLTLTSVSCSLAIAESSEVHHLRVELHRVHGSDYGISNCDTADGSN
jgi:hypothetical protein